MCTCKCSHHYTLVIIIATATAVRLPTCGLEGHLNNVDIMVRGSEVEDREDVLPARHDVGGSGANHLCYTANNHVTNRY